MEKTELVKLLTHMGDIYRQFEFPKDSEGKNKRFVESWKEYVGKFSYEDAKKGLQNFTEKESTWPPNAPELKKEARKIVDRRERLQYEKEQEKFLEEQKRIAEEGIKKTEEEFGEGGLIKGLSDNK